MHKDFNKLIRDYIPTLIKKEGREFKVVTMNEDEYRHALLEKLIEEAQETAKAPPDELVKELADLCEVIDAILSVFEIDRETLLAEQTKRRRERGAFNKRLKLISIH